ncbi:PITH1 protein, partial [Prunella himalayana]|nr:PITH1 protein [Prunella himalayana]
GGVMAHGHGPGRCRCCGEEAAERGAAWALYLRIDRQRLQCLNERREGSGATVFRPWEERGDRSQVGPGAAGAPGHRGDPAPRLGPGEAPLRAGLGLAEREEELLEGVQWRPQGWFGGWSEPEQTFSLSRDPLGELEYPTKIARFSGVHHLSMHFPKNFGAETTKIFYIGLKGEWTEAHRHEVTICNYEASANPADHKLEQITPQTHFIS